MAGLVFSVERARSDNESYAVAVVLLVRDDGVARGQVGNVLSTFGLARAWPGPMATEAFGSVLVARGMRDNRSCRSLGGSSCQFFFLLPRCAAEAGSEEETLIKLALQQRHFHQSAHCPLGGARIAPK